MILEEGGMGEGEGGYESDERCRVCGLSAFSVASSGSGVPRWAYSTEFAGGYVTR